MCGPEVVVRAALWAEPADFSARFTATWRHYRYDIWNAPHPNPFLAATAWHVAQPLSLSALWLACDPLIGEHEFSSFCRRPKAVVGQPDPSMTRRVMLARWSEVPTDYGAGLLRFEIRANAFCHQMVRSIVGTLVDAGAGRLHAGDIRRILLAKDRQAAGQVAPAHGLCLWEVGYE
jgi:tRNA pseudouridine38-40 synthase